MAIAYQTRRVVGSCARSWLNLGNLVAIVLKVLRFSRSQAESGNAQKEAEPSKKPGDWGLGMSKDIDTISSLFCSPAPLLPCSPHPPELGEQKEYHPNADIRARKNAQVVTIPPKR